jgi:hypothetical protein
MNWHDFLNDPELNNSQQIPNGRYLFGKILHDMLQCLNNYKGCVELMQKGTFSSELFNEFISLSPPIETLLAQIMSLWQYHREISETSDQWPKLIEEVSQIVTETELFFLDLDEYILPIEESDRLIAESVIKTLRTLQLLSADIQAKEYKRLWTIQKYSFLA